MDDCSNFATKISRDFRTEDEPIGDFRAAMAAERLLQDLDAEASVHGNQQPVHQDLGFERRRVVSPESLLIVCSSQSVLPTPTGSSLWFIHLPSRSDFRSHFYSGQKPLSSACLMVNGDSDGNCRRSMPVSFAAFMTATR